jgi:hypothetical protein
LSLLDDIVDCQRRDDAGEGEGGDASGDGEVELGLDGPLQPEPTAGDAPVSAAAVQIAAISGSTIEAATASTNRWPGSSDT